MSLTISTQSASTGGDSEGILRGLRDMVERTDRRGSYYIEPTWRINGIPISRCVSPDPLPAGDPTKPGRSTFKQSISGLRSSDLREIIMNACLKDLDTHRDVVDMLKHMQKKRPRPISLGDHVQNPTAGLYLYCRTQRELAHIIIELGGRDETGCFKQDVKDLIMVLKERQGSPR